MFPEEERGSRAGQALALLCPASQVLTSDILSWPDLNSREQETCQPVHVINVDIQDNHEEATLGAFLICELCQCVSVLRLGSCPLPWAPRSSPTRGQ